MNYYDMILFTKICSMKRYNPKYKIPRLANIDQIKVGLDAPRHDETVEDKVVSEIQEILKGPNTITRRTGHCINVRSTWDYSKEADIIIKMETGKIEVIKSKKWSLEDKPQIIELAQPDCFDKLEAIVNWMLR